jgi:hypothetical protein
MSDQVLEESYNRVRSRFSDEAWYALSPRAMADEIYKEIRRIDAERVEGMAGVNTFLRSAFAA